MSGTTYKEKLPQGSRGTQPQSLTDEPSSVRLTDSGGGNLAVVNKKRNFQTLNIATWNIRTLLDSKNPASITIPRRTALVAKEMAKYNIDVAGLQETHLKGFGKLEEKATGYTFYWSGSDSEENRHGVAICIKTSLIKKGIVTEPTCLNNRLMSIEIIERKTKTAFICCYAPTEVDEDAKKDDFYQKLEKLVQNLPNQYNILLVGDFNARIGQDFKQWPQTIGKHGPDKHMNNNGQRLLNFCTIQGLCIPITWFQQKNKRKTTWKHPRSDSWHMIDYIIIKTNKRQNVLRSRVFRGAECGTDHRLMKAVVKVTPKAIHKKYKPAVRFNNRCLQNETTRKEFLENIHRNASQVRPDSIQEKWKNIQTTFISAAISVLERTKSINRDWFDESNEVNFKMKLILNV